MQQLKVEELTEGKLWELGRVSIVDGYVRHPKYLQQCAGSRLDTEAKEELEKGNIVITSSKNGKVKIFAKKDGVLQSRLFSLFSYAINAVRKQK